MRGSILAALALALVAAAGTGARADVWAMLDFNTRGVDSTAAQTFRDLLQGEISDRLPATFVQLGESCDGSVCAQDAAAAEGGEMAVFGSLNALGSKIIVTVYVVDVPTGDVTVRHQMKVDNVEDLDAVAERVALAIVGGKGTDETARLGNITHQEAKPARRREGARGLGVWLGGLIPTGDAFAAGGGVMIDLSYWYETTHFAIGPHLGLRFSAGGEEGEWYTEIPLDIGVYYILGTSDFAPFFGGGAGVHYVYESRRDRSQIGGVITAISTNEVDDDAWGLGLFARAGVLMLRTYTVRVAAAIDFTTTFADLHGRGQPHHITLGVGVFF